MTAALDLEELRQFLRRFAEQRDWEQFHTPKNLAMALAGEVGELVEVFQWLTQEESKLITRNVEHVRAVEDEIADILQYVVRLADVLEVDLAEAVWRKLRENEERYPPEAVRGSAAKHRS